jgi:hypothetical protein
MCTYHQLFYIMCQKRIPNDRPTQECNEVYVTYVERNVLMTQISFLRLPLQETQHLCFAVPSYDKPLEEMLLK